MSRKIKKYTQQHRKNFGDIAEHHILNFLSAHGEALHRRNHHYDILFNNLIKIEVKSTQLGILRTGFNVRRVNHGWTTYRDTHSQLADEKYGYYALVLMIDDEVIHFRFLEADKASKNLMNSYDSTMKPRIRFGALYKSMTPKEFLQTIDAIIRKNGGGE